MANDVVLTLIKHTVLSSLYDCFVTTALHLGNILVASQMFGRYYGYLVGCGCCSEGNTCGRCCCCGHSGWRSTVHHGNFRRENHISKHTEECSNMETMATWRRSLGMVFIIARSHVTGHHHQRVTCNHSAKQDNIPRREGKGGMKEKKKGGEKACYH